VELIEFIARATCQDDRLCKLFQHKCKVINTEFSAHSLT